VIGVGLSSTFAQPPQELTLNEVIAMLESSIPEPVILARIKNRGKPFDLTTEDLVRLKKAGAGEKVMLQMLDPKSSGAQSSQAAQQSRDTPSPSLPAAYGYYILDGTAMVELKPRPVITKFGLTLADRGFAVDGLTDQQTLSFANATLAIIVYQQDIPINSLRLSWMSYVPSMTAHQFNIINTAPQFFTSLYNKSPTAEIPINLWRPARTVEMRIEPIDGKPGMYRLTPSAPLAVGRYALYFLDSLHGSDIVFSASQGRQASAFDFQIAAARNNPVETRPYVEVYNDSSQAAVIAFDDGDKQRTLPGKKGFRTRAFEAGSTHSIRTTFGSRNRTKQFTVTAPGLQLHFTERRIQVFACSPEPGKGCSLID